MMLVALVAIWIVANATGLQAKPVQPKVFNAVNKTAMEKWVNEKFASLTPAERIAQLMVASVNSDIEENTKAQIKKLVEELKVGGLIFNEGQMLSTARSINYAQSLANVPLMITIDGEWGMTMRLKDGVAYPRNLVLGAISDDKIHYEYGRELARQFRLMGIHVDFAPVMDVLDNGPFGVVGNRSYGEDPDMVARHGVAFSRGLEDGGVLSVSKHFPGHGSTTVDSHKSLPVVEKSRKELELCELIPFRHYINAGLSGVMTGHLRVPSIDERQLPSTMSEKYVAELLKRDLGFGGLVFTDALGMGGAKVEGSPCVQALKAGNDVLLMPNHPAEEIEAVMVAIAGGELNWDDVNERVKKMLRFKYALGLATMQPIDLETVKAQVNSTPALLMQRLLYANIITVIKNDGDVLPVKNLQKRNIAVITVGDENGAKSMFARRCANYAAVTTYSAPTVTDVAPLAARVKAAGHDLVIVSVGDSDDALAAELESLVASVKNVVLVLRCAPRKIMNYSRVMGAGNVKAVALTYEDTELAQDYAAQTIFGGNAANGVLPITVKLQGSSRDKTLPPGFGIHYGVTRLGYGIPQEVGFNDNLLQRIDSIANYGVAQGAFPGCEVLVARHGKVICNRAYGTISEDSRVVVDENTLYGLASVSKATGTLSGIMKLYDQGKFKLDDKAGKFIPGLRGTDKRDITMRDLLYHETGMQPSLSMWEMMFDRDTYSGKLITGKATKSNTIKVMNGAYGHKDAKLRTDILSTQRSDKFPVEIARGIWGGKVTYDSIMNRIYHSDLGTKRYRYSCLNFCLLADALQRITGTTLDKYVNSAVFAPLGAYHTGYRPLERFSGDQIAYTEVDTYLRRQHIHGYVHDELAAFSGGVQGNAGLFSNANDLAKLFQMWLNGGTYGGERFLKKSTVDLFLKSKSPNSHRGLGFDKPNLTNPENSSTCDEATAETVGHTGFTGTSFWVDPKNDMIYVFLSNRVSPTRDNPAFSRVSARSHIHSLLYNSILK